MIPIVFVCIVVVFAVLLVKYERDKDIKNFKDLTERINGNLDFEKDGLKRYFSLIFPPDFHLKSNYLNIDFSLNIYDINAGFAVGRFFAIEAKPDFRLLPLRIVKKTGFFAISAHDLPISIYESRGYRLHGKLKMLNDSVKEIALGNKKFYLKSERIDMISNIINQNNLKECLTFILSKFNAIEIENDKMKMVKYWSRKDSQPDNLIKLLDNISKFAHFIRLRAENPGCKPGDVRLRL